MTNPQTPPPPPCPRCPVPPLLEPRPRHISKSGRLQGYCRECSNEHHKAYQKARRAEKIPREPRTWRSDMAPGARLAGSTTDKDGKKGVDWSKVRWCTNHSDEVAIDGTEPPMCSICLHNLGFPGW